MRMLLVVTLLFVCGLSFAEDVSIRPYPEMTLNASYLEGDEGMPAVIIVHGFLQTAKFPTVTRLADGLNFSGYHVLSITLSLGIDNRKNSQNCSTIQFHSMDDTAREIGMWVKWLADKGHDNIELLGHSFGNLNLVAYLDSSTEDVNRKHIKGLTLISLTSLQGEKQDELDARARRDMEISPFRPGTYNLIHCNPYKTIPEMYLSYTKWTPRVVSETLGNLSIPLRVILGTEDSRVNDMPDPQFYNRLEQQGATMIRIKGANHFFDDEHAELLNQKVLDSIKAGK